MGPLTLANTLRFRRSHPPRGFTDDGLDVRVVPILPDGDRGSPPPCSRDADPDVAAEVTHPEEVLHGVVPGLIPKAGIHQGRLVPDHQLFPHEVTAMVDAPVEDTGCRVAQGGFRGNHHAEPRPALVAEVRELGVPETLGLVILNRLPPLTQDPYGAGQVLYPQVPAVHGLHDP